jgi:P2-related tail formation protein
VQRNGALIMTSDLQGNQISRYLSYLPAIFQQDDQGGPAQFLGQFLRAFEQVLTGIGNPDDPGLEELLDGIPAGIGTPELAGVQRYFDPGWIDQDDAVAIKYQRAPAEFLDWLAGWVALALRADLEEPQQRKLIARAVSLYRLRGTKRGLQEMLKIYSLSDPIIEEFNVPLQIGVHSTIGVDMQIDGGPAHFFRVTINLPKPDLTEFDRQRQIATAVIDLEKPAHTYYELLVETPTLQIGIHSTIGIDTLIGPKPANT